MFPDELLKNAIVARWCEVCNAEEATDSIDIHVGTDWVVMDIGSACLTVLKDSGRLEV